MRALWIDDEGQLTIIDEAEALAVRHLQAPFAPVLEQYARIDFDMRAIALELTALAAAAREARAKESTAHAYVDVEAMQADRRVADASKYLARLRDATRYARARTPCAHGLDGLFVDDFTTESWADAVDSLATAFARLARSPEPEAVVADLSRCGLPADVIAQGQQLLADLHTERNQGGRAASFRHFAQGRLHDVLDRIVQIFEQIDAAHDLVKVLTGEELPGFEANLVRGAARRSATTDDGARGALGRSLVDVPLDVLREQVRDLGYLVEHDVAVAAFEAVGLDARAIRDEVRGAIQAASQVSLSIRLAEGERGLAVARRAAWKAGYTAWVEGVRMELDTRRGLPAEVVVEVKRRLGRYSGRNFAPSRDALELTLGVLRLRHDVLEVHDWTRDPLGAGQQLLASADVLIAASTEADRALAEGRAAAVVVRRQLQVLVRDLQARWRRLRASHPQIPDLELDRAARHIRGVRRPVVPDVIQSVPITSDRSDSPGSSSPIAGAFVPDTKGSSPSTIRSEAATDESVVITGRRVGIVWLDGHPPAGDEHSPTADGTPSKLDELLTGGDGRSAT